MYTVEYMDANPEEVNFIKRGGKVSITYSNGDTYTGDIGDHKLKEGNGKYVWMQKDDDGTGT